MVQRSTAAHCGINNALAKLDNRISVSNWKKFFGNRYFQAELQAIEIVAASGVNITGFVNLLDVSDDLLIDAVYRAEPSIGSYNLGHIGSVLNAPTGRFATKYPKMYALAKEVHDRRYESMASHPLIKTTGKPTRRISFYQRQNGFSETALRNSSPRRSSNTSSDLRDACAISVRV